MDGGRYNVPNAVVRLRFLARLYEVQGELL